MNNVTRKYLLDTNVIIDILANRKPFVKDSSQLLLLPGVQYYASATTVTDVHYLLRKNTMQIKQVLSRFFSTVKILSVHESICMNALNDQNHLSKDFEDALQISTSLYHKIDGIITRNKKDFSASQIPIYTPTELLSLYNLP